MHKKKARPDDRAFDIRKQQKSYLRGSRRRELRDQAFHRLEGLLGEIAIEPSDLLRVGDETLVGGLREIGLQLERLVQRLRGGEFFDE